MAGVGIPNQQDSSKTLEIANVPQRDSQPIIVHGHLTGGAAIIVDVPSEPLTSETREAFLCQVDVWWANEQPWLGVVIPGRSPQQWRLVSTILN